MVRKGLGALVVALCVALAVSAPASAGGKELSHKAAAAKLRAAGISWTSSGHCSDRHRPNCTSFSGIKSGTVSGVVTFKKSSRCGVTITGGTETGHASGTYSHGNGYKIDVAITSCVSGYIKRNFGYIGGNKWRSAAGNVYFNEGDHWDITYY
jgi:hypothetical protein